MSAWGLENVVSLTYPKLRDTNKSEGEFDRWHLAVMVLKEWGRLALGAIEKVPLPFTKNLCERYLSLFRWH